MAEHTIRSLKVAILEILANPANPNAQNKYNLLGRPYQSGSIEFHMRTKFSAEDRLLADRAFEQLKAEALICPTYGDLISPEDWVEITDSGRDALSRNVLDDLDEALLKINPHLIEVRDGAWAAIALNHPDAIRQAAHSGRELIDQVLKDGAPDDEVKQQNDFVADAGSKTGITRRHRFKYLMQKYKGNASKSELKIIEKEMSLILAVDDELMASAHSRKIPDKDDVIEALKISEMVLKRLLINK